MKKGLKELKTAQRLYQKMGDREGKAYVCCALGGVYRMLGRYAESGKYYGEANRRMKTLKDTFGTAYSYCGLGNVERMAGRFQAALPFYRKAERLYGRIGDRVSYAYTLWSLGTTFKMLGRYAEAVRAFARADRLFQRTGDTRGRIYTLLGFAEIEWLKASLLSPLPLRERAVRRHRVRGNSWWGKAKAIADKNDYGWENLHVAALKDGKIPDLSIVYRRAGSKFHPMVLPVNWP
jgi:tetratricopeptide (TPR) repeat protein